MKPRRPQSRGGPSRRLWPTSAKPTLAKTKFGPNQPFGQNVYLFLLFCFSFTLLFLSISAFLQGPPSAGPPLHRKAQTFRSFSPSPAAKFVLFFPLTTHMTIIGHNQHPRHTTHKTHTQPPQTPQNTTNTTSRTRFGQTRFGQSRFWPKSNMTEPRCPDLLKHRFRPNSGLGFVNATPILFGSVPTLIFVMKIFFMKLVCVYIILGHQTPTTTTLH